MKRVYSEPPALGKPDRDFAGELGELCRAKVAELIHAYLLSEVDELLGRLRYERSDSRSDGRSRRPPVDRCRAERKRGTFANRNACIIPST